MRHRVRFAHGRSTAIGTTRVDPFVDAGERGLTGSCRLVALDVGQTNGQIFFGYGNQPAIDRTVNDRYRLSPISLARENPVAKLVVNGAPTDTFLFEPLYDDGAPFGRWCTRERTRVNHGTFADECFFSNPLLGRDDFSNLQSKRFCKFIVALVMSWDGHDCTVAIRHQYVVRDPDRNLFVIYRVDCKGPREDPGLFRFCRAIYIAFVLHFLYVGIDRRQALGRSKFAYQRMLRSHHHVRGSEKRIWTRREDLQ